MTSRISSVKNNKSKSDTYNKLLTRFNEAIESGFYLEALVLDYDMLEDRFNAILIDLDIAAYKDKGLYVNDAILDDVYNLTHSEPNSKQCYKLDSISGKYNIIRILAKEDKEIPESLNIMRMCLLAADSTRKENNRLKDKNVTITDVINKIEKWNRMRNQYIHAIFNKDYDEAFERIPEIVNDGINLARELDNYRRRLKTQIKKNKTLGITKHKG